MTRSTALIDATSLKTIGDSPIVAKMQLLGAPVLKASDARDGFQLVTVMFELNPDRKVMAEFYCPTPLAEELHEWHYTAMTFTFEPEPGGNRVTKVAFGNYEFEVVN